MSRAHFYFVSVLWSSVPDLGLNHHDIVDCWELPFTLSFSLKDHGLTDHYWMQYKLPMYTSLQLVLLLCVNNSNNYTKRCSHDGRFRYLQVPHFRSSAYSSHF